MLEFIAENVGDPFLRHSVDCLYFDCYPKIAFIGLQREPIV